MEGSRQVDPWLAWKWDTFGALLEGIVVSYRQEQYMSYVRTQPALHDLHGVEISQGGIDQIIQRGA